MSPFQVAGSAASALGKHFSIVSWLPSTIVVSVPLALIAGGAPSEVPSVRRAVGALDDHWLIAAAVIGFGAVIVGLILHPLLFGATQLLEGYWGTSRFSRTAMSRSAARFVARHVALSELRTTANDESYRCDDVLVALAVARSSTTSIDLQSKLDDLTLWTLGKRADAMLRFNEAARLGARLPEASEQIMPTSLGNVLRRYERLAGRSFGLDAVTVAPFVAQVAAETEREYLDDTRSDLDLSVRMVIVWLACTATSTVLLWRHSLWLLLPAGTFALAVLAYHSAVASAQSYGTALNTVITLSRHRLYHALAVPFPATLTAERRQGEALTQILGGSDPGHAVSWNWTEELPARQ